MQSKMAAAANHVDMDIEEQSSQWPVSSSYTNAASASNAQSYQNSAVSGTDYAAHVNAYMKQVQEAMRYSTSGYTAGHDMRQMYEWMMNNYQVDNQSAG